MLNSTQRFSNRVDNYVKYRPGYPKEIIKWLSFETGFTKNFIVADIGSGTGIFSQLLLENNNAVYAVEPNKQMRLKAEELLSDFTLFRSINGTAENTTLLNNSINIITVAQAFHWFNNDTAKNEFARILKPNGYCVLIWNERQSKTGFEKAYEKLLVHYATDYSDVNHKNINEKTVGDFFAPQAFKLQTFPNKQLFDFDGLKGRLLSSSYIPDETQPAYPQMIHQLKQIFHIHQSNQLVQFDYVTKVYAGKIK